MKYIFLFCLLAIASQASAFGGRRQNVVYYPQYYYHQPVVQQVVVVEEKIIHSPVRVERFREVKGLRLVEDAHGNTLILLGDKVLNGSADGAKVVNVTEEIKGSTVTERIITKRDYYGNQTTTVEKIISK